MSWGRSYRGDLSRTQVEPVKLRACALGYLARREYSGAELKRKLLVRFSADPEAAVKIDALLGQLAVQGLQSDQRFAQSRVRYRLQAGYGPILIRQELLVKGVDAFCIGEVLTAETPDWIETARCWLLRRHRPERLQAIMQDPKQRAQLQSTLYRRGFNQETSRAALGDIEVAMTGDESVIE